MTDRKSTVQAISEVTEALRTGAIDTQEARRRIALIKKKGGRRNGGHERNDMPEKTS